MLALMEFICQALVATRVPQNASENKESAPLILSRPLRRHERPTGRGPVGGSVVELGAVTPPYDEPDWVDAVLVVAALILLTAALALAWWIATQTGVAR